MPQLAHLPVLQVTIALDAGLTWDMFPVVLAWSVSARLGPSSPCLLLSTTAHTPSTLLPSCLLAFLTIGSLLFVTPACVQVRGLCC